MKIFKTKAAKLSGTNFSEVNGKAKDIYNQIRRKTKRRPYIRSLYFKKDKIFLEFFWQHLFEKQNWRDRTRRLKYFPCAIELIRNNSYDPISKENPNKRIEILHRFAGMTKNNDLFFVQIKENKKSGQKWLVSVFPADE